MSETIKQKMAGAGQAIADTTKKVGQKMADGTEKLVDFVKDKAGIGMPTDADIAKVVPHMAVIASCGKQIGVVDHLEGKSIKLTKANSPDGVHHFIPLDWIHNVDSQVHLKKTSVETEFGWKKDAASCE